MRAIGKPDRGRGAADFLAGQQMLGITKPQPAILLRHRNAMQAQRAQSGPEVAGKIGFGIYPRRQGRDFIPREAAGAPAYRNGVLTQQQIPIE